MASNNPKGTQSSRASSDNKKPAAKTASGRTAAQKAAAKKQPEKSPIHREIGAFVCFFLALFLGLGCFGVEGAFIRVLCDLVRGVFGAAGFYVMPFALLAAFWILLRHGGRPVRLRLVCVFFLPLAIGALGYLFGKSHFPWGGTLLSALYASGKNGGACGALSGLLAMAFESVFSRIGAIILYLLLAAVALLGALTMTPFSLARAIRNRPRLPKYEEPEEPPVDRAEQLVNRVQNKRIERAEQRYQQRVEQQYRSTLDFDLPVDDPPLPEGRPRRPKITQPAPGTIQSPSDYLREQRRKEREALRQKSAPPEPVEYEEPPVYEHIGEVYEGEPERLSVVPEPEEPPFDPPFEEPEKSFEQTFEELLPPPIDFPLVPEEPDYEPEPDHEPEYEPEYDAPRRDEPPRAPVETRETVRAGAPENEYIFPPVELLQASAGSNVDGTEEMRENTDRLNATLQSFNIDAHIVNVIRGPSVTRYELELDRGVKLSKVTNLADDIALSLGASGVRISAIPDKISVVGIEVPNRLVSTVLARDVIDSPEFWNSKSRISFAVGKDIGGSRIVGDIAKLPHMLIAGTTGSGKSVCMNSLIISLLYKARPDEVRLIMVDPKMVELGVYNGIPHLLIPVVTDPKKAAGALQWAVHEMLRRYRLMADAGVRDLESYNKLARQEHEDEWKPMEQIVVVIDELADLMLVAAKEVEESICRIAQMGRASGIHLVIATQRPSADVITGLMKANIPSRIAFAVASGIESRIILDTQGAEKLVGKGDMLYAPLGQGKPKRVQGCFITDAEVQEVVAFIKKTSAPNYSEEVRSQVEEGAAAPSSGGGGSSQEGGGDGDELLPAAVDVFMECGMASVSMLQRRLKLGYARAARIMDEMEERGIVGPFEGSKPRQLLITKEEWELLKQGGSLPAAPAVEDELL